MSKIARSTQKIFASQADNNQLAAFATMISGSPVYSDNPDTLQTSAFLQGWKPAIANNTAPFMQEDNALNYVITRNIAYLLQVGVPEYSSSETYYTNSYCQQSGVFYKSLIDNNLNNAPSTDDGTHWLACPFLQIATDVQASGGILENVAINPKQLKAAIDSAITGLLKYKGVWSATGQTDYSTIPTPAQNGDTYYVEGSATIGTITWETGDYLVVSQDVASGGTVTQVTQILNNEASDIVKLNAAQTLTNKTIDADDNTISDLGVSNFKSGVIRTSSDGIRAYSSALDTALATEKAIALAIESGSAISVAQLAASGTIALTDNSVNKISATGSVTFTLPTITDNTVFHQILVQLYMASAQTITLGTSYYFGGVAPDMSEAGYYNIIFEYDSTKSSWCVGVVNKAEVV